MIFMYYIRIYAHIYTYSIYTYMFKRCVRACVQTNKYKNNSSKGGQGAVHRAAQSSRPHPTG